MQRGRRIRLKTQEPIYLLGRGRSRDGHLWIHTDEFAGTAFVFKLHHAVNHSEQRVILAAADVLSGLPLGSSLARQNVAAKHSLAAKLLESQSLRVRISPVTGRTYAFLMSHDFISDFRFSDCRLRIAQIGNWKLAIGNRQSLLSNRV